MNTKGFVFILIGAFFECGWAYGLKHAASAYDWILTATCVIASFFIFMLALKYVGAALAYILYTGLGTIGAVILGVFIHREKISAHKAPLLFLIISSAVMFKLI
ncbi:SMR family transporter [uncultured Campylobacter sp.]|uniref:DMT family transporter n=1 Tax=uncultured Campylobacter sp. TaxID=218934 RepID=UPI002634E497|nr:SMR family transporter [uncultured Campylobacter sp.]